MVKTNYVGNGKVYLIAGGGKTYSDVAAKFCRSEKGVDEIITSPSNKKLLKAIINSNHTAALEFDDFIFGVEGYSRVTEAQLIRKRHASYMISSGRDEKKGNNRIHSVVYPEILDRISVPLTMDTRKAYYNSNGTLSNLTDIMEDVPFEIFIDLNIQDILDLIDSFYTKGLLNDIADEDLRYIKPQATEFKACIKMNATALREWARIRMCLRAQTEIRDLCTKMISLASKVSPTLFEDVGPSCKVLGYCPELEQCSILKRVVPTKKEALKILKENYNK